MRLIDADAVLKKMQSVMDMQDLYPPMLFKESVIDDMPTIDAEPIRHGKWIYRECEGIGYFVCSECGQSIWIEKDAHYCFNCGAKMDLDGVEK